MDGDTNDNMYAFIFNVCKGLSLKKEKLRLDDNDEECCILGVSSISEHVYIHLMLLLQFF